MTTSQSVFEAGEHITLAFELSTPTTVSLVCHSAYGTTIVTPNYDLADALFTLPENTSTKKGILDFKLISKGTSLYNGSINIIANTKNKTSLESYIGPPSISAGTHDYTMLVVVPTDSYDNPIANNTPVSIKHQFLDDQKEASIKTNDLMAWKTIHSDKKSGRILVSSTVNAVSSKEFAVEVFPSQPTNFTIDYHRKHTYADGNQITTFTTSVIKDTYGNTISDGTLVDFTIKNQNNSLLKTQGMSINGVATAFMLHPDHEEIWNVSAHINGMATSNTITINYKAVTEKLPVHFSNANRRISIGPLQSFMEQLIPDGAIVKLTITKNEQILETKLKTTANGMVSFDLEKGFYPPGTYSFIIEALGLTSIHSNIKL
ncbi:hypothetical protein [Aquimarina agarilytica]|uniref:hypothetical protein n=1 Tax=Aquimarina agarilytica TaxID=1087449 RepID=UPI000288F0BB|nr:hypothetical protein [Aquimarina agarilytica]